MRVRIVNDGQSGHMTKITNAETGEDLSGLCITEIYINVMDKVPYINLRSVSPSFDVVGEADLKYVCPHCGHAVALQNSAQKEPVESVWDI